MPWNKFEDERHLNWLRDGLALFYVKEGLEKFVDNKTKEFHDKLREKVYANHICNLSDSRGLVSCTTCTSEQVQKTKNSWEVKCNTLSNCRCQVPPCCDSWLRELLHHHADAQTMVKVNFIPHLLSKEPFETAKVYMPFGSSGYRNAKNADPFSLLKFLKNCMYFVVNYLKNDSALEQVILIRCRIMHSYSMRVDDAQLETDMDKMVEMLKDLKNLSPEESDDVEKAITKIKEVRTKTFGWAQENEFKAIEALLRDLDIDVSNKLITQDADLQNMKRKVELTNSQLQDLNSSLEATKQEVNGLKTFMDWFWRMTGMEKLDGIKIKKISSILYGMEKNLVDHEQLIQLVQEHVRVLKRQDEQILENRHELLYSKDKLETLEGVPTSQLSSLEPQDQAIEKQNAEVIRQTNSLDSMEQQMEGLESNVKDHGLLLNDLGQKHNEVEQKLADHDRLIDQISASSQPQELMPTGMDMVDVRQTSREMYKMQADIARYLEIAFLAASEYPDLSREIRLTSNEARALHQMTLGLMKHFYASADNIVDMLLPMIRAAIEVQDAGIITDTYGQMIETATDMRTQSGKTKERCEIVNKMINQNINMVKLSESTENKRSLEVKEELGKMQERRIYFEAQVRELETEQQKLEEQLQLCSKKKENSKQIQGRLRHAVTDSSEKSIFLGLMSVPLALMSATQPALECAAAGTLHTINTISYKNTLRLHEDEYNELLKKEEKSREALSEARRGQRETASKLSKSAEEIAALTQKEQAIIRNISSLQDANWSLTQIDCQLTKMMQFWDDIIVVISSVYNKTKASKTFAKEIRNPAHTRHFLKFVGEAEKSWNQFKGTCKDYIDVCSHSPDYAADQLYRFLYTPVDNMTGMQRKSRQNALIDELTNQTRSLKFY